MTCLKSNSSKYFERLEQLWAFGELAKRSQLPNVVLAAYPLIIADLSLIGIQENQKDMAFVNSKVRGLGAYRVFS